MKKCFAILACSLALAASTAGAQGSDAAKPGPAAVPSTAAPAPPAVSPALTPGLPAVESADIRYLNQNQAERTAVQPGNLAPTWRTVKEGRPNYSSFPYPEAGVLIQPKAQFFGQSRPTTAGEAWRQYRNGPLTTIGGWLFILACVALVAFYLIRGQIRLKEPRTGRLIERYTPLERLVHWTVAISFVTLALTGLTMLFGKYVVLPVFGHTLFGVLGALCKNVHNFVGPIFTVSTIVLFIIFVKDNLPGAADARWLARAGGAIGEGPVHAGRFNAGQKLWFWGGVVVLGLLVSASGFVLDMLVPGIGYTRGVMQLANVFHLIAAVLFASLSLAHIYLGTIGMEGAYQAMRSGYVDDTWAKEHHDLWYDDIRSGRVPRVRSEEGAAVTGEPLQGRI
jgi:formate dehydrogenase subunit gamma